LIKHQNHQIFRSKTIAKGGGKMDYQVEHVARAFYDAAGDTNIWENASETLKEEFRGYARDAIVLCQHHRAESLPEPAELSDAA
jgi:hypothetical protein